MANGQDQFQGPLCEGYERGVCFHNWTAIALREQAGRAHIVLHVPTSLETLGLVPETPHAECLPEKENCYTDWESYHYQDKTDW